MNKRTVILLLICFALAATTFTLRYIEKEKEKIKSQFIPPPEPVQKRMRWVTTTVIAPREENESGQEVPPGQPQSQSLPAEVKETPYVQERSVSDQTQPARIEPPPATENIVPEPEILPPEPDIMPEREEDIPYGADLVTPLEESPVEDEAIEYEEVEPEAEEVVEAEEEKELPDEGNTPVEEEVTDGEEELSDEGEVELQEEEYLEEFPLEEIEIEGDGGYIEDEEEEIISEEGEVPLEGEEMDREIEEEEFDEEE